MNLKTKTLGSLATLPSDSLATGAKIGNASRSVAVRISAVAVLFGALASLLTNIVLTRPWATQIDVGGRFDDPYLRGFYHREEMENGEFRWSRPDAAIVLPGVGAHAAIELRLQGKPNAEPVFVHDGRGILGFPARNIWRHVHLMPHAGGWSGDIELRLATAGATIGQDSRRLGVAVDGVAVRGWGTAVPLGQAIGLGLTCGLMGLLAGWTARRPWTAALASSACAVGFAAILAVDGGARRLLLTAFTGRMLLVLVLGAILALAFVQLIEWAAARVPVPISQMAKRALVAAALFTFVIRFGGMAYPLTTIEDMRFYLARARMVRDGQFLQLFLPNPSLTPTQWDVDGTVPRSPLYYLLTAPFMYLPEPGPRLALMAFSSAVDALAVLLVAAIVLRLRGSGRAAVLAALLAGSMPLGLRLATEWGVFGTLLAQCLTLLAMATWLALYTELHTRRTQLIVAAALALAFLAYPTALLFLGLTGTILVAALLLKRDLAAGPTLRAGILAILIALALFYAWHIPALVTRTIPALLAGDGPTGRRDSITAVELLRTIWQPLKDLFGLLVLVPAIAGSVVLLVQRKSRGPGVLLLLAWLLSYPILALANGFVVTFILKHLLYMLPALAILGAVGLDTLSGHRWGRWIAVAVVMLVVWQGLAYEVSHIARFE